jgi:D-glycero-alpha-D-manno-heptose-7-phosphate kinase
VIVNPLRISDNIRNELESSLVACFSGDSRDANSIIAQQTTGVADHSTRTIAAMDRLKADAAAMKNALLVGDIKETAEILEDSGAAKKLTAAGVSTQHIERVHEVSFANGALAGKVSGAGGGGFLMFVPPEDRLGLITALNAAGQPDEAGQARRRAQTAAPTLPPGARSA